VAPSAPPAPLQPRPQTVLRRVPAAPAPASTAAASAPEPVKTYFESVTTADQPPLLVQRTTGAPPPLSTSPVTASSSQASALLRRLRDPASIRDAIVMREVLGPPKAFQLF